VDALSVPRIHTQVFPWIGKKDYNLTTDMADEAINYMKELNAAAPCETVLSLLRARRQPLTAPTDKGVDRKIQGKFGHGLERNAHADFANPKRETRVIPANTQLTPWPNDLKNGTLLRRREEAFRASGGSVRAYRLIRITRLAGSFRPSRTWASWTTRSSSTSVVTTAPARRGHRTERSNQFTSYNGILDVPVAEQMKAYDAWGF